MLLILSLAAFSFVLLRALVAGSPVPQADVPRHFQPNPITRRDLTADTVKSELGPLLSSGTLIFGSTDPAYAKATSRWITFVQPDIEVVVEPAAESDISKIVKYCNDNSIEFLARNRGHGMTQSLNRFKGLQIGMDQLQSANIQEDGQTVLLQGGAYAGPVINYLWDQGYVTSTGAAFCVGLAGLGLGGGHGRLEGLYGLVADGIVQLNVVLADGSEAVVSATSNEDLFWAMKGAGHNFAIVTSSLVKIYPKPASTWHYHGYTWTGDKLETVFEELNKLHVLDNGTMPPLMSFESGVIAMNPAVSTTEPVMLWSFAYNGPAEDAEKLLEPFNAIGSEGEDVVQDVPYPQIAELSGTGETGPACTNGPYVESSNMIINYNVKAQRQLYDLFKQNLAQYPDLANGARLAHEGYSNKAVQAIPAESAAYAHRAQNLIVYFLTSVPVGSDLHEPAEAWAKQTYDIWNGDLPPNTYVNYAAGHPYESLESLYGYEPWRLDRLRGLKAKYDPNNSFGYFVPIISESS
ncbi:MAG: hypothetical protein Q9160_003586 [Pyrenula sp. 1 TL-2023]